MKNIVLLLSMIFGTNMVFSQGTTGDSAWIRTHYYKIERKIPMRDNVTLFTSIYIPLDTLTSHPILMTRTPYSCAPYGEDQWRNFWDSYEKEYFKENYIMVIQDVRGRWMSEGKFVDVRPFIKDKNSNMLTDEASDTYDAIEWLIKNLPHNNQHVGVFGISYPGFYSTMAAASGHPALKAVSPQAPVTNWFLGDDFHHNGAFFQMDAFSFYSALGSGFGQPHPGPTAMLPRVVGFPIHDNYQFYLHAGNLKNLANYTGDTIAFWKDIYNHPNYDSWWKARDARNATPNLIPAMLWVGGLFDAEDNWGAWNAYKAAEENNPGKSFNKLVMGPWFHTQWASDDGTHLGNIDFQSNTSSWYQQNIELPFFNFFLKGIGDVSGISKATIFVTGSNEWKHFAQWPPAGKQDMKIYLHNSERLGWTAPEEQVGSSSYISDPSKPVPYTQDVHFNRTRNYMTDDQRFASRRPDVLVFQSELLSRDVTVTGNIAANLYVSISTTDADFVVKIIDVFPDSLSYNDVDIYAEKDPALKYPMGGYQMLVHGEIFRGRFRKSYEYPQAFVPNQVDNVSFKVGDVAHTFKTGHRIMVQIQSSWFPLVDRNPQTFVNIYNASEKDFTKATISIFHNRQYPSSISLPVLK